MTHLHEQWYTVGQKMTFPFNFLGNKFALQNYCIFGTTSNGGRNVSLPLEKKPALRRRRISHSAWLSKYKLRIKDKKSAFAPRQNYSRVRSRLQKKKGKKKLDLTAKNSLLLSRCFFLPEGKKPDSMIPPCLGRCCCLVTRGRGKEIRERKTVERPCLSLGASCSTVSDDGNGSHACTGRSRKLRQQRKKHRGSLLCVLFGFIR